MPKSGRELLQGLRLTLVGDGPLRAALAQG
jgi:hypothetical protein